MTLRGALGWGAALCWEREDMEGRWPRAESGRGPGGLFVLQPRAGRTGRFAVVPRRELAPVLDGFTFA